MEKNIITISREFGSGGRSLGTDECIKRMTTSIGLDFT